LPVDLADGHENRDHVRIARKPASIGVFPLGVHPIVMLSSHKVKMRGITLYIWKRPSWDNAVLLQEPPMRDWLFLLAPPAVIFYFIAFPDRFYSLVTWARTLLG